MIFQVSSFVSLEGRDGGMESFSGNLKEHNDAVSSWAVVLLKG